MYDATHATVINTNISTSSVQLLSGFEAQTTIIQLPSHFKTIPEEYANLIEI